MAHLKYRKILFLSNQWFIIRIWMDVYINSRSNMVSLTISNVYASFLLEKNET